MVDSGNAVEFSCLLKDNKPLMAVSNEGPELHVQVYQSLCRDIVGSA